MRLSPAVFALALVLTPALTCAAPAPPSAATAQLLAAYSAAWARSDAKALAALYTPDAELISVVASADGRDEIERLYESAFSGLGGSTLSTTLERVRQVARGIAYGRGTFRIDAAGSAQGCGRFVAILQQRQGIWRIAAFSEATLACDQLPQ